MTEPEREALRRFWLGRFTFDELRELGRMIWPELVDGLTHTA